MQFTRFGITLQRLEAGDLEMVRNWRNSAWVRPYMRYREVISPDEQTRWFQSLDPERDWYFVARAGEIGFALFHIKGIDWNTACGEAGGFVGLPDFIGRPESAGATLALMDFGFHVLELESLLAHYSANLPRILRFNRQLGYVVMGESEDGYLTAKVSANRYLDIAAPMRRAALTVHGPVATLVVPGPWLEARVRGHSAATTSDFHLKVC